MIAREENLKAKVQNAGSQWRTRIIEVIPVPHMWVTILFFNFKARNNVTISGKMSL